jgi:hypothetical protein
MMAEANHYRRLALRAPCAAPGAPLPLLGQAWPEAHAGGDLPSVGCRSPRPRSTRPPARPSSLTVAPINPSARYVAAWRQPPERSTHG